MCILLMSYKSIFTLCTSVCLVCQSAVNPDSIDIAASLFEYAGELGDTNALYTFAQLLRTGTPHYIT